MESFQMFIYSQGTPSRAPWLNFNGMCPEWGGLYSHQFTLKNTLDLIAFIDSTAPLYAAKDKRFGIFDVESSNPFHASFNQGWPHKLWREKYLA
ncbi:TPA: hypothetical protein ACN36P_003892 [Vibrio parahaemolyticus]